MFEGLSDKLSGILDRLTRRGALSAADVDAAAREVRRALLEADVALEVVRTFIDKLRERAVGVEVVKSVTPGQMVVKIVHDQLVETLGATADAIDLNAPAPVPIMMVGLQGSGKTTTTAKLARRLQEQMRRKVLMASLDTRRPAAMEQLAVLGQQVGVNTLPIMAGQTPVQIARRAIEAGRLGGYDVVLLDTAGRTTLDSEMMAEAAAVRTASNPHEVLLVADSLTGQDAVNLARAFDQAVGLTGIVLTRVDGDGRGGAALSMRAVTGKPIKLMAPARGSMPSKTSTPPALPTASSAWATSFHWSRRPPPPSTPKRPCGRRNACERARSISTICASSLSRCKRWAVSAG